MERAHEPAFQPERDHEILRQIIARECRTSDDALGTFPGTHEVCMLDDWQQDNPAEAALAQGFFRGRKLLQAVSYGHTYWRVEYGLGVELDDHFAGQHPTIVAGTKRLFQLVLLSKAAVEVRGDWTLPTIESLQESDAELCRELGIDEAARFGGRGRFPGVGYDELVEAILAGRVRVGRQAAEPAEE